MSEVNISILIPVRNGVKHIAEAINSIINQDIKEIIEVLIIDDGSTDGTVDFVDKNFHNLKTNIILLRNPQVGISAALNYGLTRARGRYIVRMDADDICHPKRLSIQLDLLRRRKCVALIGSNIKYFYGKSGRTFLPESSNACRTELFFGPCCAHPTYMIDRERIAASDLIYVGPDNAAQDYEFLARLSEKYDFSNVSVPLLSYRVHAGQVSSSLWKRKKRVIEIAINYWRTFGLAASPVVVPVILWPEIYWRKSSFRIKIAALIFLGKFSFNSLINSRLSFAWATRLMAKFLYKAYLYKLP